MDRLATFIEGELKNLGAQIERFPREKVGDILLAKWNADRPGNPILFMMHMDTVWPLGTLAERPVHVEGDKLIGPGTYDMKASIALVLTAIGTLRDQICSRIVRCGHCSPATRKRAASIRRN